MNQKLTLERALTCIREGVARAHELGFRVAIAVVDDAGHLVACHRMDGALWVTPEFARAKANASVAFRATTLELEQRFKERPFFVDSVTAMNAIGPYQFVIGRGGVPLVEDGEVIGAVGVSGAVPPDNDHVIADAAAGHPVIPKSHG
jgi:uncharacterized protein GlcG (DUF336 family)